MKLKHKILTLIAGTLTTFALTSCNDFLDRDPLGQFTEDDAPNALIGGKMYNVYYLMRSYNLSLIHILLMYHLSGLSGITRPTPCVRSPPSISSLL